VLSEPDFNVASTVVRDAPGSFMPSSKPPSPLEVAAGRRNALRSTRLLSSVFCLLEDDGVALNTRDHCSSARDWGLGFRGSQRRGDTMPWWVGDWRGDNSVAGAMASEQPPLRTPNPKSRNPKDQTQTNPNDLKHFMSIT